MPANIHFMRKLAVDELRDTFFCATGVIPTKEREQDFYTLKSDFLTAKIFSNKKIILNGKTYRSISQTKYAIQEIISSC